MLRKTALALVIGGLLMVGTAGATTPGPVCRQECAPRIAEDCGQLRGKAFRRCRKSIVRACKQSTPELACALGAGSGSGNGGGAGGGSQSDAIQELLATFGNKRVTTGSSDIFSSGSITETQEMRLCSSGSVSLVITTITSTSLDTFDSTESFDGTWTVRFVGGAPVLELDLGEAQPRQLSIQQDNQSRLVLDGKDTDIEDATGECGGVPGQPGGNPGTPDPNGTPDLAQQVTEALAGHALVQIENNVGFGRRTTGIVLCSSTRYVMDITVSASPGRVDESIGTWTVELESGQPVLVLADDQGGTPDRFTVGSDAQGNLLLNNRLASEGDSSQVPGICAQL